jgi:8-amino-7-oxononanoate synthase
VNEKLHRKLRLREEEGTMRSLSLFDGFVDFFSNDYLGLARVPNDPRDEDICGGTGSRLISGSSKESFEAETAVAHFFNAEAALIFNSGYDANLGFYSSVPQRGDTVLYDERIHASIRDGVRLGFAQHVRFKHNDLSDLHSKLKVAQGNVFVGVESLYSMDGDIPPLREMVELCHEFGANLIIDEAHACGVFGVRGKGIVDALNLTDHVLVRLITFGKAYGSHGAAILCSDFMKAYLINFARSFIYTTALPPEAYRRIQKMICLESITERTSLLQDRIAYFRTRVPMTSSRSEINSPIQIIPIGNVDETKELANKIQAQRIGVKAILTPTVPIGKEGIRICIHAFNTNDEINRLADLLKKL